MDDAALCARLNGPSPSVLLQREAAAALAQQQARIAGLERENERLRDYGQQFVDRAERSEAALTYALAVVNEQALDEGLWFVAQTAPEAYLQRALRRIHAAVEGEDADGGPLRTAEAALRQAPNPRLITIAAQVPPPAPAPDALIAAINAFLADAPKGKPHTGYRYGELLEQAAAALAQMQARIAEQDAEMVARDGWLAQMVVEKLGGTNDLPAWVRESAKAYKYHVDRADSFERETYRISGLHAEAMRMVDRAEAEAATLRKDAERYRFLRSPLASETGPVQAELWQEIAFKLCRDEAMDREVDAAMRLLSKEPPSTRV